MELRHLKAFIVLSEELHFGRAAERLHMTQPPLSQLIQRLEREVGPTLVQRDTRNVHLTPAGEAFLIHAKRAVHQSVLARGAARAVSRGELGSLNIGYTGPSCFSTLPKALGRFRDKYSRVDINLQRMPTTLQVEAVREHRLDVGMAWLPTEQSEVSSITIRRPKLSAILPMDDDRATRDRIELASLADEDFIAFKPPGDCESIIFSHFIAACRGAGFLPNLVHDASSLDALAMMVGAGIGIAVMTPLPQLSHLGVVSVPLAGENLEIRLGAIWRKDNVNPTMRPFLQCLEEIP